MDRPEIKYGDKVFLFGQYMKYAGYFDEYEYNAVKGYMTLGYYTPEGHRLHAVETPDLTVCVPGFVSDFLYDPSLAVAPPFNQMEMVDVTGRLSQSLPLPSGTKVWMPKGQLQ